MKKTHRMSSIAGKSILIFGGTNVTRLRYIDDVIEDLAISSGMPITREVIDASEKGSGIEAIRQLLHKSKYTALGAGVTVFVLLQADHLSALTQNVLLKSLEEVSNKQLFILESQSIEGVLPTISSRVFPFPVREEGSGVEKELPLVDEFLTKSLPELFVLAEEYAASEQKAHDFIMGLLVYMRTQINMRRTDSTYINYTEFLLTSYEQIGSLQVSTRLILENCILNFYSIFKKI